MKLFWWFALVGIGVVAMADDEYDDYYYDDDYDRDSGKFIKNLTKNSRKKIMKKKLLKKHSVAEYVLVAPKYFKKISIKKKSRIFVGHSKDGHWTGIKIN